MCVCVFRPLIDTVIVIHKVSVGEHRAVVMTHELQRLSRGRTERERVGNSSAEWRAGREHREAIVHFSRGPQRVVCTCSPPVQIAGRPSNCQQRSFTSTYRPSGWIGWSVHTEAESFLLREAWLCGGSFSSFKCVCVLDHHLFFFSLSLPVSLSLSW